MAKSYTIVKKHDYPERAPELLDKRPDGDPAYGSPYDRNAPGLYPNERVVEVDGERVAVSVDTEWLPNNSGVALHGFARVLEPDGSTREDEMGRPIETSTSNSFDQVSVDRLGLQQLVDASVKLVLGEPLPMVPVHVDPDVVNGLKANFPPELMDAYARAKDDHTLRWAKPDEDKVPIINVPEEVVQSASIRAALDHLKKLATASPRL